jgi:hypothetical protein
MKRILPLPKYRVIVQAQHHPHRGYAYVIVRTDLSPTRSHHRSLGEPRRRSAPQRAPTHEWLEDWENNTR